MLMPPGKFFTMFHFLVCNPRPPILYLDRR